MPSCGTPQTRSEHPKLPDGHKPRACRPYRQCRNSSTPSQIRPTQGCSSSFVRCLYSFVHRYLLLLHSCSLVMNRTRPFPLLDPHDRDDLEWDLLQLDNRPMRVQPADTYSIISWRDGSLGRHETRSPRLSRPRMVRGACSWWRRIRGGLRRG